MVVHFVFFMLTTLPKEVLVTGKSALSSLHQGIFQCVYTASCYTALGKHYEYQRNMIDQFHEWKNRFDDTFDDV